MNYEEARQYLEEISAKGNLLGLESIEILLRELGDPQDRLQFIHIAGTNGKGSVMAYLESVLIHAGYRVGRYLSPALFAYEEKIQINGKWIPREDLARLTGEIRRAREKIAGRGDAQATIFEVETAISFLYFLEQGCDVVLLETGMGGREDATNIVNTTVMEILSSISMDHMEFLGESLSKIAWNKAGIIKKNTSVVSDSQDTEAAKVIQDVCEKQHAGLTFVQPEEITEIRYGLLEQSFSYHGIGNLKIHMAGTCQIRNAALAVEAAMQLQRLGWKLTKEDIRSGLEHARWEGRFQIMHENPMVIMDGAHNPDAAKVLMDAVEQYFQGKKIYYIFGVFSDKEYDKIIRITSERAEKIFAVETKDNPRALPAPELAEAIRPYNPHVTAIGDVRKALERALEEASRQDVILVFGSLSFLWEIRQYFL